MANRISLDKKERLFLSNQLEILKNQQIIINSLAGGKESDVDTSYYDNQIKALREGYELHYGDPFEDIYDGLPYEQCRFVLDVLEMYRGITYSFLALQKSGELKTLSESDIKFAGFDLNTETQLHSYARYFLFDLDRYAEIKKIAGKYADFNSHTSFTKSRYEEQLKIWEGYRSLENRYLLTEEQIIKLLGICVNG